MKFEQSRQSESRAARAVLRRFAQLSSTLRSFVQLSEALRSSGAAQAQLKRSLMQLNSSTSSEQFKRSSAQLRSVRSCADQCSLTQLAQLSATLLSFVQLKRRLVQPSAGWRSSGAAQA